MRLLFAAIFVLFASLAALAYLVVGPVPASKCVFILGFRTLHDTIPDKVGECQTNAYLNLDTGEVLQETTRGRLIMRTDDGWTGFDDGTSSWVYTPTGLQTRPDTIRFEWEADYVQQFVLWPTEVPSGFVLEYDSCTGECPRWGTSYARTYVKEGARLDSTGYVFRTEEEARTFYRNEKQAGDTHSLLISSFTGPGGEHASYHYSYTGIDGTPMESNTAIFRKGRIAGTIESFGQPSAVPDANAMMELAKLLDARA